MRPEGHGRIAIMQTDLFTEAEKKTAGKTMAEEANANILGTFRDIAADLGRRNGRVTIDDVRAEADRRGTVYTPSNWMGSVFKGYTWEFTGEFIESTHLGSHGRMIRVWKYTGV